MEKQKRGTKRFSRVYLEITNICNRNCSFCPGTTREPKRISTDSFKTACERLRPFTDYLYLHLMGEPLSHPNLCEMIEYAKAQGFKCAITTNGTLIDKVGEDLLAVRPYKVNISVHSFEKGTDEEFLEYLNKCFSFADKASREGILTVIRLWNRGFDEGRNLNILALLKERFLVCEWKEGARGVRIRDKLHLEYGDRFEWPDLSCPDLGDAVFCHGLEDHIGVLCDGTVVPCCLDREGAVALGNIFEESLDSIISSPRATAIIEGFGKKKATEELCRKCGYARRFKI